MKRFIYISTLFATLALGTTSCKNEIDDIFDKSPAERTEAAMKEYSSILTDNGGKWVLEYFSNSNEPGYIYIVTFDKNGSVTMTTNNMWIGNETKSEVSTWDVIADNGPVLSFSSYNPIFHIFADPDNVLWPGVTEDDQDELGYGHKGDYEFMLMESEEGVIRLKGKKWGITHYLRQIPSTTNDAEYLAQVSATEAKMFHDSFKNLIITDANGYKFMMNNKMVGVASIYPLDGDPITQTHSFNYICTTDGIRFMTEVEADHAKVTDEPSYFQTFTIQADGSLLCSEDNATRITAEAPNTLIASQSIAWVIDPANIGGKFKTAYDNLETSMKAAFSSKPLKSVSFYATTNSERIMTNSISFVGGSSRANVFVTPSLGNNNEISYTLTGEKDKNAESFLKKVTELQTFCDVVASTTFVCSTDNVLMPSVIKMTSTADANDYMYVTVQ